MRASLWLCLGLPALALEALGLRDSPQACVLTTAVARAGAAQALEDIKVYTPRGSAERAALESLAAWCGQFTSFVSLAPPDGLLLEIGQSLTLFGGVAKLVEQVQVDVADLGYQPLLAIAPTPLAAIFL